jgi:hypothetical protein
MRLHASSVVRNTNAVAMTVLQIDENKTKRPIIEVCIGKNPTRRSLRRAAQAALKNM